jgi:hypothetical protein
VEGKENKLLWFNGTELQFYKIERVKQMDSGDDDMTP